LFTINSAEKEIRDGKLPILSPCVCILRLLAGNLGVVEDFAKHGNFLISQRERGTMAGVASV
jgi:hypothetical protein